MQVCLFAFDILYFNDKPLVRDPFRKRRDVLRSNFKPIQDRFMFATTLDTKETDEIALFMEEAIKGKSDSYRNLQLVESGLAN